MPWVARQNIPIMYGTRTETITKREVRHVRTVNGKVVVDDYDQHTDRDVEYTPGKRSYQALHGGYDFNVAAIENGAPRKPKEMVFETETDVQDAGPGSFDNAGQNPMDILDEPIGTDGREQDSTDAPAPSTGASARSGYSSDRELPRRRSSAGSTGGLKSASVILPMKKSSVPRRETPSPKNQLGIVMT